MPGVRRYHWCVGWYHNSDLPVASQSRVRCQSDDFASCTPFKTTHPLFCLALLCLARSSQSLMGGFHVHIVKPVRPVRRVEWVKKTNSRTTKYRTVTVQHTPQRHKAAPSNARLGGVSSAAMETNADVDDADNMPLFPTRVGKVSKSLRKIQKEG